MRKNAKKNVLRKNTDKAIEVNLRPGNYPRVKELSLKIVECFDTYSEEEVTYALANVNSFRLFSNMQDIIDLKAKGLL